MMFKGWHTMLTVIGDGLSQSKTSDICFSSVFGIACCFMPNDRSFMSLTFSHRMSRIYLHIFNVASVVDVSVIPLIVVFQYRLLMHVSIHRYDLSIWLCCLETYSTRFVQLI